MLVASISLTLGAAFGAVAGRLLARLARWVVKKTRTPRDDAALEAVERFLREHPEVVDAMAAMVDAATERK